MTTVGWRSWRRFGLAAVGLAAFLLLAAAAQAGPPNHPALPGDPINGFALNKACGAATDSSGNIYVSSAGNDAIEVFSPAGGHLATITNTNEPCGLAVDSDGDLYVSETDVLATGTSRVVRYTPTAYPLPPSPSWSDPVPIDSSAGAEGIAVDRTDDRLYVAKGDHVAVYDDDGSSAAQNEVQGVLVDATGGTYTLSFEGQTTAPLANNATNAEVDVALEALPTIGSGNVSVTPGPAAAGFAGDHLVTFVGALANTAVPQLTGDESALSGGFGLSITTQTQGFSGRIGEGDLTDATGVAAYTYGGGDRYVSVADDAGDEIRIFSGVALHSLALTRTVDGSGTPDGRFGFGPAGAHLAADPSNGHFFVYDHAHSVVDEFEATGEFFSRLDHPDFADAGPTGIAAYPQRDEVQRLTIGESRATGGTFTLAFEGEVTEDPLPYDAPAAQVQAALEGLAAIGAGNVVVTGGPLGAFGLQPYRIQFTGALGRRNVSPLVADGSALTPAGSTATVTTLFEGSGPGRVYVTAGPGVGAELKAFGPLAPAGRTPLPELSKPAEAADGVAVDSQGNIYVSAGATVTVYSPTGSTLATIPVGDNPANLAVDPVGNLYVLREGTGVGHTDHDVLRYAPNAYPFVGSPSYGPPTTVAESGDPILFPGGFNFFKGIAVNPANGHLFLGSTNFIVEFSSAASGSTVVNPDFAPSLGRRTNGDLDVHAATGEVYISTTSEGGARISRFNAAGTQLLGTIDGSDAPDGRLTHVGIAVDQANGHVVVSRVGWTGTGFVEEYEASGAFVSRSGPFTIVNSDSDVAVDGSSGPNRGNLYLAYLDDLSAFGPLSYGEPPRVATGLATAVAAGAATLNGSVDPTGFPVTDCHFEYTDAEDFTLPLPTSVPCAESAAEIGSGTGPVAVHADVSGLDPQGRYRFRLVAANEFGTGAGDARPVGPPVVAPRRASGVHYTEAVLNARLDPFGLSTTYRFEYGTEGPCDAKPCDSTPQKTLAADAAAADVKAPLVGLEQGTTYHFRLVAENAAGSDAGADGTFTTLSRPLAQSCPNAALRTGPSAALPDCRAYELVTPADTRGATPHAEISGGGYPMFNNWLVTPTGPSAGNSLVYYLVGTLPGSDGNGRLDGHRAQRGAAGWASHLFSPSHAEAGGDYPLQSGVSPDHGYSFWTFGGGQPRDSYLRTPAGFEPIGRGSLDVDPVAEPNFITAAARHVIFSSTQQLEPAAAPAGTRAVYDRSPGGATHVVSLLPPDDATPGAGQHASYQGISEDGSAIAFKLGGSLYVRRGGETVKVADSPSFFAGFSDDGGRVFYTTGSFTNHDQAAGGLFAFDVVSQATTQIAADSLFVNVSADGSRVYFTSQQQLGDAPLPADLSDKLYLWDGSAIRFVTVLAPEDLVAFGDPRYDLAAWVRALRPGPNGLADGRALALSRTSPDGRVLLFQSHADLSGQNPDGVSQVYRYDSSAGGLTCVSCPPSGDAAAADARFQSDSIAASPITATTLIPNVTADGQAAVFESADALLPEDVNGRLDVYKWQAHGSGGCARPGGCLALISTGRAGRDSFLYSMTPDGHDVFFATFEQLVAADEPSSYSIYDARVDGGFAEQAPAAPCVEDACQSPAGAPPPPTMASVTFVGAGNGVAARKVKVLKKSFRGAAFSLNVKVPGAGVLAAGGRNLKGSRRRVGEAGSYKLTVRLTRKARRALKRRKRMKLTVRVRFTPREGEASQATVSVTARQPKKKGKGARNR